MNERLTLTVVEAAAALGVHHLTLRKAIERGELQVVRVGKRILVPRRALDKFLEGGPTPRARRRKAKGAA